MNIGPSHRMLINSNLAGPKWRVNWRCEGIVGEPRIAGADNAVRIQQWQWLRQDGADEIISKIEADIDVKKTFLPAVKELQRTPHAQTIFEIYPYKTFTYGSFPLLSAYSLSLEIYEVFIFYTYAINKRYQD